MELQDKIERLEKHVERFRELARKWGLKDEDNLFHNLASEAIEKGKRSNPAYYYETALNFLRQGIKQIKEYRARRYVEK